MLNRKLAAGILIGFASVCLLGSSIQTIAYNLIEGGGSAVAQRSTLNFISGSGATVTVVDNSGAARTDVTIAATGGGGGLSASGFYLTDGVNYYLTSPMIGLATLPSAGSFSWINQGGATETASNNALILQAPPHSGLSLRARVAAIGANSTATMAFNCTYNGNLGGANCGVCFYESGTGKFETLEVNISGASIIPALAKFTNTTTSGGVLWAQAPSQFTGRTIWARLQISGGNITYYWSQNGVSWSQLWQEAQGQFFTTAPDNWGYFADAENSGTGADIYNTLLSFKVQ